MPRFKISIFVTKKLRKEMIKKSKLKNNFKKSRNHESWCKFKTHRNYCVNLLRKSKKQYSGNINVSDITDNKSFWKSVKPYFSDKGSSSIITNDKVTSKTVNTFFINTAKRLKLKWFRNVSYICF